MKKDKRLQKAEKKETSIVRSSAAEYLTFVAASGQGGVEAVYADENIWLSQKMMGVLYDVNVRTVNEHLKKIFSDSELQEDSVIRKFRITAADGKDYNTLHYNLSAIIAVGYKVNSERAVQFRKWATQVIQEFTIKEYTMDDERLKNDGTVLGKKYFEEQLERIREIRLSERKFYQKITDIYATSIDYAVSALIAGLALLVWSADRFVEGSASTARHFGMPPLLIGMVIVGFGTSAPEMVVSTLAAFEGSPGIALGNAYGSNIANIALILGVTALISPIMVHSTVLRKELPILTLLTVLSVALIADLELSRLDAAILLLVFGGLMAWTIYQGLKRQDDSLANEIEAETSEKGSSTWFSEKTIREYAKITHRKTWR